MEDSIVVGLSLDFHMKKLSAGIRDVLDIQRKEWDKLIEQKIEGFKTGLNVDKLINEEIDRCIDYSVREYFQNYNSGGSYIRSIVNRELDKMLGVNKSESEVDERVELR